MFKLLVLAGSVLAFTAAPAMADGHADDHMEMEPPPGIFIPLPPDVEMPPPEDGPEMFVEFAMSFLDKDGDGVISHEELMEALMAGMHHDGDGTHHDGDGMHHDGDGTHHDGDGTHHDGDGTHHDGDGTHHDGDGMHHDGDGTHHDGDGTHHDGDGTHHDGDGMHHDGDGMHHDGEEVHGISEGDEGLEGLPYPAECGEDLSESELGPVATNVSCGTSESEGNQVQRTVCNVSPYDSAAISLPSERAADCFRIAAIKGNNIAFEIVNEDDGTVLFDMSMGKEAFDQLVLTGGPDGAVYRINLLGADEADASITVEFIDHPTF